MMENNLVEIRNIVIEREMGYKGEIMLRYRIEYPQFSSRIFQNILNVINRYYKAKAIHFKRYYENTLYKMAVSQYEEAIKNNFPFNPFEAIVTYQVTYNRGCILSLYTEEYQYTGGAHGNTVRQSQTWNLQRGGRVSLSQLFTCKKYSLYIQNIIKEQIRNDPEYYFEDYAELVEKYFNEKNFYLATEGIVIYYQLYEIAPYASGIREFVIPYSSNCAIDPQKLCGRFFM